MSDTPTDTQSPADTEPEAPKPKRGKKPRKATYVGADPDRQNSATDATAPTGKPDEIAQRVIDHDAAMVQPQPGEVSFQEWVKKNKPTG